MANYYVEQRDGGYYITGTRISLDSVVYAYLRGESMLGVVESFPSLSLNQVTSAVEFYLANRALVDEYLREERRKTDQLRQEAERQDPTFYAKLEEARQSRFSKI